MSINILQEEGRRHYNCSVLEGVEVENQGGSGTATSHWERRVLGVMLYYIYSNTVMNVLCVTASTE